MGVNKVEFGGDTLIDLTEDSVAPETMIKGTTAHNSAGEQIEGTFDPDIYQTKTDESLETDDKSVVGAINELNGKSLANAENISVAGDIEWCDSYGIWWDASFYVTKDEGDTEIADIPAYTRLPLVAGDNVTFDVVNSDSGSVVKINATGGGSGGGTTVKYSEGLEYSDEDAGFVVEGIGDCTDIDVMIPPEHSGRPVFCINAEAFEADGTMRSLYIPKTVTEIRGSIFSTDSFVRIHIYCEAKSQPDGWSEDWNMYLLDTTYIEWGYVLGGGAGGSNSGGSLQMPQIRFANFTEYKNEEDMTMYRFTVENLGGGTLQAGDKLQICCRRKYPGGKKKLRKMIEYEITEEDINQRFLKIEVNPNGRGGGAEKWLFRNDRKRGDTLSAMYFRLKRVTKYSDKNGRECDAIFSNVETVWKTYLISYGEDGQKYSLRIK